ncbi:MAG: hypothetical protein AAGG72_03160 [Pseudomonadota bacterium]
MAPGPDYVTIVNGTDRVRADFAAGASMLLTSGLVASWDYRRDFGDDTTQHAGSLKVSLPF